MSGIWRLTTSWVGEWNRWYCICIIFWNKHGWNYLHRYILAFITIFALEIRVRLNASSQNISYMVGTCSYWSNMVNGNYGSKHEIPHPLDTSFTLNSKVKPSWKWDKNLENPLPQILTKHFTKSKIPAPPSLSRCFTLL